MLKRDFIRNIVLLVIAFAVLLVLHIFVFSTYRVRENDANTYLKTGDLVVVQKNKTPAYKDFVVYQVGKKKYVGRIIGQSRDDVTYMDDIFYLNNMVEPQNYLNQLKAKKQPSDHQTPFTADFNIQTLTDNKYDQIPKDHYLILNDDRQNLEDSRTFGLISSAKVEGVVTFKLLPSKDFGFVKVE